MTHFLKSVFLLQEFGDSRAMKQECVNKEVLKIITTFLMQL